MNSLAPLLTIAIPTWNRAPFLAKNLEQLRNILSQQTQGEIEILVSNNASSDNTNAVVENAVQQGLPVRLITNRENIGSDANIAQVFDQANGKYVLLLGDDDLLTDNALTYLMPALRYEKYGVITLRPYGFNRDFRKERPGTEGKNISFDKAADFLATIGPHMTFISACVINKRLLPGIKASAFCGCNLVQTHLLIRAALAAGENLYLYRYLIACKRNNSGGYNFFTIFVTTLFSVIDQYKGPQLNDAAIQKIENKFLLTYYPDYLFRQLLGRQLNIKEVQAIFDNRFGNRLAYILTAKPAFVLPRPAALLWTGTVTAIGRIMNGDLRRGLAFIAHKLKSRP